MWVREREVRVKEGENETLRGVVGEKVREIENLRGEVRVKERDYETLRGVVQERDREVRVKEGDNKALRGVVQERDREVRLKEGENEALRGMVQEREKEVQERERAVSIKERENESVRSMVQEREREVRVKSEEIQHLQRLLQEKDRTIHQLKQTQQVAPSYTCLVSGTGLQSATANHPTRVVVELSDSSGSLCSLKQNVTAELILQSTSSQATPTSVSWWPWTKKTPSPSPALPPLNAAVAVISPSRYEVSYTAVSRGPHKLHVRVNDSEINGSPFTVTVYPDPTQLGYPVSVVKDLNGPYVIAFNSRGEMIVSGCGSNKVSVFDVRGRRVRTVSSHGDRPEQMEYPAGIAVDDTDNIYVSSKHKLQKFTSSGKLIKCIGRRGSKEGELNDPRGVIIHSNQVYVCDRDNHRIQVFDLDLSFIRSISSRGSGRGEFDLPYDVAFDNAGNMYVVEVGNNRVQVMDSSGQFIRMFGQEGEGKLRSPTAIHIADEYVYVSHWNSHRIAVYETSGQHVTSFGRYGRVEGEFKSPYCITSCVGGFIKLCV